MAVNFQYLEKQTYEMKEHGNSDCQKYNILSKIIGKNGVSVMKYDFMLPH